MTHSHQSRVAGPPRCPAAIAVVSLSLTTVAQAPPQASQTPPAASSTQQPLAPAQTAQPAARKHQVEAAESAYLAGARLLDRKDLNGAETEFTKATRLDPTNHDYILALTLTHRRHVTELIQQ